QYHAVPDRRAVAGALEDRLGDEGLRFADDELRAAIATTSGQLRDLVDVQLVDLARGQVHAGLQLLVLDGDQPPDACVHPGSPRADLPTAAHLEGSRHG